MIGNSLVFTSCVRGRVCNFFPILFPVCSFRCYSNSPCLLSGPTVSPRSSSPASHIPAQGAQIEEFKEQYSYLDSRAHEYVRGDKAAPLLKLANDARASRGRKNAIMMSGLVAAIVFVYWFSIRTVTQAADAFTAPVINEIILELQNEEKKATKLQQEFEWKKES
jgi:hypothetical protein